MNWIETAFYAVFYLGTAVCTVLYFWSFFRRPHSFRFVNENEPENLLKKIGIGAYVIAAFFGTYYCIYRGVLAAFSWWPQGWELISDGDAFALNISASFWLSFLLHIGMFSMNNERLANEARRKLLESELSK